MNSFELLERRNVFKGFLLCVVSILSALGYSDTYTLSPSNPSYTGHSVRGGSGSTRSCSYVVNVPEGMIADVRVDKTGQSGANWATAQTSAYINGAKVTGGFFDKTHRFTSSGNISISATATADISWREPIYYTHPTLGPIILYWEDHYYTTYYYQVNYNISVTYSKAYPDLSATASVSPSPYAAIDEAVKLKLTVKNSGYKASDASVAKIYDGGGNLKGTVRVGALSVGRTESHEVTLSGLTVGSNQTFRVVADADYDVEESNESNNQATISLNVYQKVLRVVRFHSNGGRGTMPNQRVVCGTSTALSLNKFTREDYVFSGWATTPNGGVVYKDEANVLTYYDNVDLYAVWSVKTCNVTFKSEDEEIDVRSYSMISPCGTSLPVATKKNCDFIGWFTEPNGGVQITSNTIFKADSTVYARFSEPMVTITLDSGTGETVQYEIPAGESKLPPNPFVKDGYKFVGWHTSKECVDNDGIIHLEVSGLGPNYGGDSRVKGLHPEYKEGVAYRFNADQNMYAVWSPICTLRFDSDGGIGYMADKVIAESDYVEPECKFTRVGAVFAAWDIRRESGNVLYHKATWGRELPLANSFTGGVKYVTENSNSWKVVHYNGVDNLRSAILSPKERSRVFIHLPRIKGKYFFDMRTRGEYSLYRNGVHYRDPPEVHLDIGRYSFSLPVRNTLDGYNDCSDVSVRRGELWFTEENVYGNGSGDNIDFGTHEIKSRYGFVRTVTYCQNEASNANRWRASSNGNDKEASADGKTFTLIYPDKSIFVPTEYNLPALKVVTNVAMSADKEWTAESSADWVTIAKDPTNPCRGIVTVRQNNSIEPRAATISTTDAYAITINQASSVPSVNVFFDVNGGSMVTNRKWYALGRALGSLPEPIRENYSFLGWYTQLDGGVRVDETTIAQTNCSLFARWVEKEYVVKFDCNGGLGDATSRRVVFGEALGNLPELRKEGCVFVGWATKPEGGIIVSGDGTVSSNIKLYARWIDKRFTIVLHKNDGSGTIYEKKIEYGKSTALPGAAADLSWAPRRGFSFMGWSTSEKSKTLWKKDKAVLSTTVPVGETFHAYAIWQLKAKTAYAIQYIRNDGSGSVRTIGFNGGVATKLNSVKALGFERRGYTFVGWAKSTENARAKKVWKKDMGVVSQPVANGKLLKVYAIWKLAPGYYSIRFNKNDGSGKWRELGYKYGDNTTLPTIANGLQWSRAGYTFGGWATSAANASKGIVWRGDKGVTRTPVAAGKTLSLYAIWRKASAAEYAISAGVSVAATRTPEVPDKLLPGYYSGLLADGTGTYDLLVDEGGETGYVRIVTEDGVFEAEVDIDLVGDEILVGDENGKWYCLRVPD